MEQADKAVVILSGGLDSTTCMGIAQDDGYELYPITFDYGQRHRVELEAAIEVAKAYQVSDRHRIIRLDFLKQFGGSSLTEEDATIPDASFSSDESEQNAEIPSTYVPGRNLLFLSIASSYAETIQAKAIYIGVNARDYSGYPDCRPEFIQKVQETIEVGTKMGDEGQAIRIHAPLLHMSKKEIVETGTRLNVPYHLTVSCYKGAPACGRCDSCYLRLKGFAEAGLTDPIEYAARDEK